MACELRPNDAVDAGPGRELDFLSECGEVHLVGIGIGSLDDREDPLQWLARAGGGCVEPWSEAARRRQGQESQELPAVERSIPHPGPRSPGTESSKAERLWPTPLMGAAEAAVAAAPLR